MKKFLVALAAATSLVDVNIAAGMALERLESGDSPDAERASEGPSDKRLSEADLKQ